MQRGIAHIVRMVDGHTRCWHDPLILCTSYRARLRTSYKHASGSGIVVQSSLVQIRVAILGSVFDV
jgi:hypothetical protein